MCLQRPFVIELTQEGVKPQIRQFPSTGGNILGRDGCEPSAFTSSSWGFGAVRASVLKGQLGRRPQHPLPVAVLSELGKSGGPEIKAYFSRDQLILERELRRWGRSRVNREDGQGSESLKRHEIFAATPQLNVRLYPKAKGSAASLYGDPLPKGCINRSPFLLSAEIRLPVTQFFPLAKPSLFHCHLLVPSRQKIC